jgi:arylsulfatase A-like enzyme
MYTPSRASMMTGKYPFKIGMQNWVVQANEGLEVLIGFR